MRIVVEDLSISNLLKTKTIEGTFLSKIKLLLSMFIIQVREVRHCVCKADKWFASSKICSCCGVKYDHSVQPEGQWSLKIREWRCASCNSYHDRDVNASINLSRWVK